ncbi:DNA gyrase inhibitor YacG [Kiloniella laminariae]|uniref:DNA gyrase inhibitor YacG n=1 Tax=Kiloniella laminariae TaxID=454162 RepID=A0ABT4LG36_9PROT|nr:DNA gyrase inhibitor YacG [Kiloniella laminariae]MCZ4280068.1 DNA gyrase inhibitor YacG [Kiloniella laminariae]
MSDPVLKKARCPICKGESAVDYKPFCSRRCADVDLNRWLSESYRIPTSERSVDSADDDEIL